MSIDRLLATQSKPRNEALAHALWVIGVAERQGVGIKTMYRTMLREGHRAPEITEAGGELTVRLEGGQPDVGLRSFFEWLEQLNPASEDDPSVVIAIRDLLDHTPLRPERLAELAQRTPGEAMRTLVRLESAGVLERLLDGSRAFRLSAASAKSLGSRVAYRRSPIEAHRDLIYAYLDESPDISREQAATLIDLEPVTTTRLLGKLEARGDLEYVGASRGRNVRYRRPRV